MRALTSIIACACTRRSTSYVASSAGSAAPASTAVSFHVRLAASRSPEDQALAHERRHLVGRVAEQEHPADLPALGHVLRRSDRSPRG